jgi:bifunctional non-homologous end joining protein LigD
MTDPFARLNAADRDLLRPAAHPEWVGPMLATLTERRFSDPAWIYERKLDGERVLGFRHGEGIRLLSRTRRPLANTYPELADALAGQEAQDFVVDGEVVAFERGQTRFSRLQQRLGITDPEVARHSPVAIYFYLFDLLHLEGQDTTRLPLRARKSLLRTAMNFGGNGRLRFTTHRKGNGQAYLEHACSHGWEGIIAKRANAPYASRRSPDWLKMKCSAGQELVIGGFTEPAGSRTGLGALLVGYYEKGSLRYAGKVGTGFSRSTLTDLRRRLGALEQDCPPFEDPEQVRGAHWVRPELVAEVAFTEWTEDGKLRHPRFEGLRQDKPATDVSRERPTSHG